MLRFVLVLLASVCEANSSNVSLFQGDEPPHVTINVAPPWEDVNYETTNFPTASNREILTDLVKNDQKKTVDGAMGEEDEFSGVENAFSAGSSEDNDNSHETTAEENASGSVNSGEDIDASGSSLYSGNRYQDRKMHNRSTVNHNENLHLRGSHYSKTPDFMKEKLISFQDKDQDKLSNTVENDIENSQLLRFGPKNDQSDSSNINQSRNQGVYQNTKTTNATVEMKELGSSPANIATQTRFTPQVLQDGGTKISRKLTKLFKDDKKQKTGGEPEFSGKDLLLTNGTKHFTREQSGQETVEENIEASGSGESVVDTSRLNIKQNYTKHAFTGSSDYASADFREDSGGVAKTVRRKQRQNHTKQAIKGLGENEEGKTMAVDPLLLLQMRKIRINVLMAQEQATKELDDARKEFRAKMDDLQEDLALVKTLTNKVHQKIGITVRDALQMARQAKINATSKLNQTKKAAMALDNIEKKLGVEHTLNASKILRSRIPYFPKMSKVALYQQLLQTNAILTKLEGAKTLAIDRAEKGFRSEEKTGNSIEEEVDSLKQELASAEDELSTETEVELEDEREAQEKLQEAVTRNRIIAKKTALALSAIENYLEKLESDESRLERLRF